MKFAMILPHLCVLLSIFLSVVALSSVTSENRYFLQPRICRSNDCETMANVISSTMNKTANPCDNFYEYACGAWTNSNGTEMPPDRPIWNRIVMFNRKLEEKLRKILESKKFNSEPVEKAKRWYRSCMNEEALNLRGIRPLTSIAAAVGGWPVSMTLGRWDPSDYTWQEIETYYSRIMGSYALYNLVVNMNSDAKSANVIVLKSPELPLSSNLQISRKSFDIEDRGAYAKLITGVARAFATAEGSTVSDAKITKEVNNMIDFEIQLNMLRSLKPISTVSISRTQILVDSEVPITKITDINLWKLISNLVVEVGGLGLTESENVHVEAFYLIGLRKLLQKTSFRTIVNYVHWHYLSRVLHATNSQMRNLLFEYVKDTVGVKQQLPRWEQCVYHMEINHALAYQFVQEYFTEDTFNAGSVMISNIQSEMAKQIDGSTWMDDRMKKLMIEKLWNVRTLIGSPDWYKNFTVFDEYYKELTVSNDYFNNVLKYRRFTAKKMIQTLRVANERTVWMTDPITINAYYILSANSLNIPAAIFQDPIFTPFMPASVKYGILGSILGHELSHGFDDSGCRYDRNGDEIDWSAEMLGAYTLRSRCFIEQYGNLTNASDAETEFLGPLMVGENIADTMGVQSAFNAYRTLLKKIVKGDRTLPGFEDLTSEQLFLLSYATIWCETATPEYKRKKFLSSAQFDPHSPARIRVLASMSNTKGFAEAFNCPVGSPMNPREKCNIWTGRPIGSRINVNGLWHFPHRCYKNV